MLCTMSTETAHHVVTDVVLVWASGTIQTDTRAFRLNVDLVAGRTREL